MPPLALRAALALLLAVLLAPAASVRADDAGLASSAAPAAPMNPVEKHFKERQYQAGIDAVTEVRKAQAKPLVDAETEYWGARCAHGLKLIEESRERFIAIANAYPTHERGMQSAIEKTTVRLNQIEGRAKDEAQKKIASDSARELEATGAALAGKKAEIISRAYYVAGNAWRIAGDLNSARRAYELSAKQAGEDYPAKALYMLGIGEMQDYDLDGARARWRECSEKFSQAPTADKCNKGLVRLSLIGTPAPELDVETWVHGSPTKLADLRGRVVLLWFFATWCPHCKETMPEIAALQERYRSRGLSVIGLTNNSKGQTTEIVKGFVADPQWHIDYPTAVDNNGSTSIGFNATGIPSAALIDRKGNIRFADHPTYVTDEMIERLLDEGTAPSTAAGH